MHPSSSALPASRSAEDIRSEIILLIEEYARVAHERANETKALPSTKVVGGVESIVSSVSGQNLDFTEDCLTWNKFLTPES
jgi:hypothetical protein